MSATSHANDHHHHPFQAHHFETGEQQFQAGKLGMWLFLATEVLFFSGMFCAYAVYRMSHPEVFQDAAQFLSTPLGAGNTIVLLASSLSVAWGVRCAQLNKQGGLLANLMFTLTCAGIFLGVKAVEYTLKFYEGLYWRGMYSAFDKPHPDLSIAHDQLRQIGLVLLAIGAVVVVGGFLMGANKVGRRWALYALGTTLLGAGVGCLVGNVYTAAEEAEVNPTHAALTDEHPAEVPPAEVAADDAAGDTSANTVEADADVEQAMAEESPTPAITTEVLEAAPEFGGQGPKFPGVFFSIYYAMTGVHAIHILAGIGVFIWIVSRAARKHFEPEYYGPVEYTGLYWHLVDLIWIYLFPLLYLIE